MCFELAPKRMVNASCQLHELLLVEQFVLQFCVQSYQVSCIWCETKLTLSHTSREISPIQVSHTLLLVCMHNK